MPPQRKQRKIAIMGYRSVGKSSLTIQFVENQFVDSYDPTIENTFTKPWKVRGQDFELKLVDTAGQDEYAIFPAQHSMDMHGYVLVYSITSVQSFELLQVLLEKIMDMTGKITIPLVIVGNKTDLHRERVVSTEEGKRLADTWKASFYEVSARSHESVCEIFNRLITEMEKADGSNGNEKSSCVLS
uniref:GTP-binding protein Rheb n=1 Tax=Daphnia galeata TaxID=27404 RepID=A0A8J2WJD5_9CRUS|nr:unnamed protein product [Daphnia galeata]